MTPNDFGRAVEGPITNIPIMYQMEESVWWLRELLPKNFELRIYITNELFSYIAEHVTVNISDPVRPKLWGIPIYRTDGEGLRWWVGVPGFVIPQEVEYDPADSL